MEAVQVEINKIKSEAETLRIKNHLLKVEYNKVRELNHKLQKIIKDINKVVSCYIEEI